jgi:threonine dehydrogenase-like Zn-dependent dehydrogenase
LSDKIDIRGNTCSNEFSGIVARVGSVDSAFKVGDRVVALAANHGGTYEQVPEWACCKLNDDEDYNVRILLVPSKTITDICVLDHGHGSDCFLYRALCVRKQSRFGGGPGKMGPEPFVSINA